MNGLVAGWARSAQGAGEHPTERTRRCVREGAEAATPRWPVRAATA